MSIIYCAGCNNILNKPTCNESNNSKHDVKLLISCVRKNTTEILNVLTKRSNHLPYLYYHGFTYLGKIMLKLWCAV